MLKNSFKTMKKVRKNLLKISQANVSYFDGINKYIFNKYSIK